MDEREVERLRRMAEAGGRLAAQVMYLFTGFTVARLRGEEPVFHGDSPRADGLHAALAAWFEAEGFRGAGDCKDLGALVTRAGEGQPGGAPSGPGGCSRRPA